MSQATITETVKGRGTTFQHVSRNGEQLGRIVTMTDGRIYATRPGIWVLCATVGEALATY